MKKLLSLAALMLTLFTSCLKDEVESLQNQINELKEGQIADLQIQTQSIKESIKDLEETDKGLDEYIKTLQAQSQALDESIKATDLKIDNLKTELETSLTTEKANLLAEIEALRSNMQSQLDAINSKIATLQAKDEALSQ